MKSKHNSFTSIVLIGAVAGGLSACAGTPSGGGETADYVIGYDEEPAMDYLDTCVESYTWEEGDTHPVCNPEEVAEPEPEPEPAAAPEPEPSVVIQTVTLDSTALFAFDSAELRPGAEVEINDLADDLMELDNITEIVVSGHTDSIGTEEYNEGLSERRAQSVVDALTDAGVDRNMMTVRAFGENRPVATNETDAGRQKNRRVEIVVRGRQREVVE